MSTGEQMQPSVGPATVTLPSAMAVYVWTLESTSSVGFHGLEWGYISFFIITIIIMFYHFSLMKISSFSVWICSVSSFCKKNNYLNAWFPENTVLFHWVKLFSDSQLFWDVVVCIFLFKYISDMLFQLCHIQNFNWSHPELFHKLIILFWINSHC